MFTILYRIIDFFSFDGISLSKSERKELRKIERDAYIKMAKVKAKERGESKAKDKYS